MAAWIWYACKPNMRDTGVQLGLLQMLDSRRVLQPALSVLGSYNTSQIVTFGDILKKGGRWCNVCCTGCGFYLSFAFKNLQALESKVPCIA